MLLTEERSRLKFPEGITSRRGRLGKNTVDCFAAKMAESVQARLVPSLFLFGRALWFSRFLQLGRRRRRVRRGLAVGGFLGEPQRPQPLGLGALRQAGSLVFRSGGGACACLDFLLVERGLCAFHVFCALAHEHPVVDPQVSHFMQVPLRTSVKLPHSPQASPS